MTLFPKYAVASIVKSLGVRVAPMDSLASPNPRWNTRNRCIFKTNFHFFISRLP